MATFSNRNTKDVIPNVGSKIELDENVQKGKFDLAIYLLESASTDARNLVLPPKSTVLRSFTYGTAAWTRATRIIVALGDGTEKSYFLKDRGKTFVNTQQSASDETGREMIEGEFASITEIAKYKPSLTPIPYAKGKFQDASIPTYFFLMEFLDIDTGAPDPAIFSKELAALHADSISPTGRFGFHVTTCHGPHPQNTGWEDSWRVFFSRLISQFFAREITTNGPSKDGRYERAFSNLVRFAIPQLLDPLQSDGRALKPSLVHGDLWDENCGTELQSGQPKIYDAAVFYGHNEYDLGMWRATPCSQLSRPHFRQYLRHVPPSEPREQWDDRNRLYSIKFDIAHSIGWPDSCESQREVISNNMGYLNDKYGPASELDAVAGAER